MARRILSISTGFTTNFAEEYLFEKDLFKHGYLEQQRNKGALLGALSQGFGLIVPLLYGIIDSLSAALPALIVKPIHISYAYYSIEPDKTADNFLLSNRHRRLTILKATMVWFCLQALRLAASHSMYRRHAEQLSSKQRTIVHRSPGGIRSSWSLLDRARLLRLARLFTQMMIVEGALASIIALMVFLCIRHLDNGNLLYDWLARTYLEFDTSASCLGSAWSASFWLLQLARSPLSPIRSIFGSLL